MNRSFYLSIKKILFNKFFFITLFISVFLSYFVFVTSNSVSIDDLSGDRYYYGELFAQGRFTATLIQKIFPSYIDFGSIYNFFGIAFLAISSVIFCVIFERCNNKSTTIQNIVFSCLFVTFPMHAELFIYNGTSWAIGLGCILISLALYQLLNFLETKRWYLLILPIFFLILVASWYESVLVIYVLAVFVVLLLSKLENDSLHLKDIILKGLVFLIPLLISVIAEYLIGNILLTLLDISKSQNAENNIFWDFSSFSTILSNLIGIIKSIVFNYFIFGFWNESVAVFAVAFCLFSVLGLYTVIKTKSISVLLCVIGTLFTPFFLSFLQGYSSSYRVCQPFSFFVGISAYFMLYTLNKSKFNQKKVAYKILSILLPLLIVFQIFTISECFKLEKDTYDSEKSTIISISNDLKNEGFDLSKPTVFIGQFKTNDEINSRKYVDKNNCFINMFLKLPLVSGVISESLDVKSGYCFKKYSCVGSSYIRWGVSAFGECNTELFKFMEHCGITNLKIGTLEQYKAANKIIDDLPSYPDSGYISDQGDYILVNFGSDNYNGLCY